jgi:hypothetical protein
MGKLIEFKGIKNNLKVLGSGSVSISRRHYTPKKLLQIFRG